MSKSNNPISYMSVLRNPDGTSYTMMQPLRGEETVALDYLVGVALLIKQVATNFEISEKEVLADVGRVLKDHEFVITVKLRVPAPTCEAPKAIQ